MAKTLYLNPNKIEGYWTSNIAQKLTDCSHDVNFHCANLHHDENSKSIWIYGLASITGEEDSYASMKPGHKGGELQLTDKSWKPSETTADSDQFLALQFHYDSYEVYDFKTKERKQVEPCSCEWALATVFRSILAKNKNDGSEKFAITIFLTGFPKQLADQIKGKPLPFDDNDQMATIVIQSLTKPLDKSFLDVELPSFNPPSYGGGSGGSKRYKSPSERMTERENAIKDYVVATYESLGYNSELTTELKDALGVYPLNPLTLESIVTVAFSAVSLEERSKEIDRLKTLLHFAVTLL